MLLLVTLSFSTSSPLIFCWLTRSFNLSDPSFSGIFSFEFMELAAPFTPPGKVPLCRSVSPSVTVTQAIFSIAPSLTSMPAIS